MDICTYWEGELPKCTTFSQQTHTEFKRDVGHDAFMHENDEGPEEYTALHAGDDEGASDEGESDGDGERHAEEDEDSDEEEADDADGRVSGARSDDEDLDNDLISDTPPEGECSREEEDAPMAMPQPSASSGS